MEAVKFDLEKTSLREINQFLHADASTLNGKSFTIDNPNGAHSIAVGLNSDVNVTIKGHAGYYAAGMNQIAKVTIEGSAGSGVAENMMSGFVHVKGFASNAAGATANGGLLVIDGDAGLRCGISLKGADIVVGGSVGSFSAFMAQAGNMVILGVTIFMILEIIGVDIRPLLAGAGILGLAVGFGSQTLIKDLVSGVFIIMENQYSVGDEVKIGTYTGKVVRISFRSTVINDIKEGMVYVSNGSIGSVANLSQAKKKIK